MDTQNLDGYFTNLVYEMEGHRSRLVESREDACRDPQSPQDRRLLPWLAGLTAAWFGVVTLGHWL
jgi:hypothetical protein